MSSFVIIDHGGRIFGLTSERPGDSRRMLYTLDFPFDGEKKPIMAERCDIEITVPGDLWNQGLCLKLFVEGKEVYEIHDIRAIIRQ